MAKELPYFKFEPNQWENGNIQFFDRELKGLFIDLCSMYWSRLGELDYALALQKLCNGNADDFDLLMQRDIFLVEDEKIVIEFLDEQLDEFQKTSIVRSKAAHKRWDKSKSKAKAMQLHSKSNAIREEKRRGDKIKEEEIYPSFEDFWDQYDKKVGKKEKIKKKWDRLDLVEKEKIMHFIPNYKKSQPDKKFRKNPETFLNNESWNDEIISINQDDPQKLTLAQKRAIAFKDTIF